MIVTPFGDLDFASRPMSLQWIAAHGQRHRTYELALSRSGQSIAPAPLFGELDGAWVQVHYLQHLTLLRSMLPDASVSTLVLSASPMRSEAVFNDWHHMHNLIHTRLDQALQVT